MQFGRPTNFAERRRLYNSASRKRRAVSACGRSSSRQSSGIGKFRRRAADADRRQILRGARAVHPQDRERPFPALALRRLRRDLLRNPARTCGVEYEIGLSARTRMIAGALIIEAVLEALSKRFRSSPARIAEAGALVTRAITFDLAITQTLYLTLSPRRMRRATKISTQRSASSSSRSARFWAKRRL
jgi:hypothetical protein